MSKPTKFQKDHPEIRPPKVQHIRSIKPEFFIHEGVSEMSVSARFAELGLWTCCDWYGRFEWRPKTLKIRIMPFDEVNFEALMCEWVKHGFVEQYEVDGQTYGRVLNWEKHQAINRREKDANVVCPAPAPHTPSTCLPVLARAMSAGVGTGVGSDIGLDTGIGNGDEEVRSTATADAELPILPRNNSNSTPAGKERPRLDGKSADTAAKREGRIQAIKTNGQILRDALANPKYYSGGYKKEFLTDLQHAMDFTGYYFDVNDEEISEDFAVCLIDVVHDCEDEDGKEPEHLPLSTVLSKVIDQVRSEETGCWIYPPSFQDRRDELVQQERAAEARERSELEAIAAEGTAQ